VRNAVELVSSREQAAYPVNGRRRESVRMIWVKDFFID
jgi:hypothetical protein